MEEGSKAHPDQAQGPALIPAELDAFSTIFWAGLLNYWELEKFCEQDPGHRYRWGKKVQTGRKQRASLHAPLRGSSTDDEKREDGACLIEDC